MICFEPDNAGITTTPPLSARKDFVAANYPDLVQAWNRKRKDDWEEALHMKQRITDYAVFFRGRQRAGVLARRDAGVACDKKLLPGMKRHFGELRPCATHARERGTFLVCNGCRVAHHAQVERDFERNLLMTEGARVPVCGFCARRSVLDLGEGHRGCACDQDWQCFRCREDFLRKLAKARQRSHVEGKCGKCDSVDDVVEHVKVCLLCQGVNVYSKHVLRTLR